MSRLPDKKTELRLLWRGRAWQQTLQATQRLSARVKSFCESRKVLHVGTSYGICTSPGITAHNFSSLWVLTKVEDGPKSASKLMNPLGATVTADSLARPPATLLLEFSKSTVASAMATAPQAAPASFQPHLRAAEAMLSATALQNPPPAETAFLFWLLRVGLTFCSPTK